MNSVTTKYICTEYVTKFKWRIENFSTKDSRGDPTFYLETEPFSLYKSRLSFCLKFYPVGSMENCSTVSLEKHNLDNEKSVYLGYEFYIQNSDGDKIVCKQNDFIFNDKTKDGPDFSVNYSDLYGPESDFIKVDDVVYICCKIKRNCSQPDFKPIDLNGKSGKRLFESHQSDESGMCVVELDTKKLKLDKSLITLQSDVLGAMLHENYVEGKSNVIKIKGFKQEVLEEFFASFYNGYVSNSEFAKDLFVLADKYNVQWMKKECEEILSKLLSMDNIFDHLNLISTYTCLTLKPQVLKFVSRVENFEQIMRNTEWCKFMLKDNVLANEILGAGFKNLKNVPTSDVDEMENDDNEIIEIDDEEMKYTYHYYPDS